MRLLLIANTLFEFAVGIVMIFLPTILFRGEPLPLAAIALGRVLGCNAFALGTLSWFMQGLTETRELRPGLIALSVFHSTVAIAQFFNFRDGITAIPVVVIHSLFAASFLVFLWKKR